MEDLPKLIPLQDNRRRKKKPEEEEEEEEGGGGRDPRKRRLNQESRSLPRTIKNVAVTFI